MQVMLTRTRLIAGLAAAAALVAGCSSEPDAAPAPRDTQSAPSTTATPETSATPAANAATTDACRSLADDQDLKQFWSDLANQGVTTGVQGARASMAVMRLGTYTTDADVEPDVADAMEAAVTAVGDMNVARARGADFDVEQFRDATHPGGQRVPGRGRGHGCGVAGRSSAPPEPEGSGGAVVQRGQRGRRSS